ncbi:MAG: hypothetical protein ABI593_00375 [Betaproteobacteria bacterium]
MSAVWIFFAVLFGALAALMLVAGLKLAAPGPPPAERAERSGTPADLEAVDALDPQT